MRIVRYRNGDGPPVLAVLTEALALRPLPYPDFMTLAGAARRAGSPMEALVDIALGDGPGDAPPLQDVTLMTPLDAPEIWAAGVTYRRSQEARNAETTSGRIGAKTLYDLVYEAERPELFFKSTAARVAGPGSALCVRSDSRWQIPEPEIALVLDGDAAILGYTLGNDMSCRDIEGENPLYLPQAKIWKNACAIGPAIRLAQSVADPYRMGISLRIRRGGKLVFEGKASTSQLKRRFDELAAWLKRDNVIFPGTVLLTGTCIVPPDDFSLLPGDTVEIESPEIGTLVNPVCAA